MTIAYRAANAAAESFWHTLKNELIHRRDFQTREEASQAIFEYISKSSTTAPISTPPSVISVPSNSNSSGPRPFNHSFAISGEDQPLDPPFDSTRSASIGRLASKAGAASKAAADLFFTTENFTSTPPTGVRLHLKCANTCGRYPKPLYRIKRHLVVAMYIDVSTWLLQKTLE